jgi:hypothetical protein
MLLWESLSLFLLRNLDSYIHSLKWFINLVILFTLSLVMSCFNNWVYINKSVSKIIACSQR